MSMDDFKVYKFDEQLNDWSLYSYCGPSVAESYAQKGYAVVAFEEKADLSSDDSPEKTHNPYTLLVVDNKYTDLSVMQRSLARDGLKIIAARDSREAFDLLFRTKIDGAIIDYDIPGMNGLDLMNFIKMVYPTISCCLKLSGFSSLDKAIEAVTGGLYGLFEKPNDIILLDAQPLELAACC